MHAPITAPWVHSLALLLLCAPYLQGAALKSLDFRGAVTEVSELGLVPAAPLAAATIGLQLVAPALILVGWHRWLGALSLAAFTVLAASLADRFWQTSGADNRRLGIAFTEHVALAGAMLLVAWQDLGSIHG